MKPLIYCPGCNSLLVKLNSPPSKYWIEQHCPEYCQTKYHQHFPYSYEDDTLLYISFQTEHFLVYVYFEGSAYPNIAHFYSLAELHQNTVAHTIAELPANQIDLSQLDALDQRLQTLSIFS